MHTSSISGYAQQPGYERFWVEYWIVVCEKSAEKSAEPDERPSEAIRSNQ